MARSLGPGRPAIRLARYPHLLQLDALLWDLWLLEGGVEIEEVWYDVHVGTLPAGTPIDTPAAKALAEGTLLKRIDVVAHVEERLWVIELKPYANHQTLGQIISYAELFALDYRPRLPLVPTIICAEIDPDIAPLYTRHGVTLHQVSHRPWVEMD